MTEKENRLWYKYQEKRLEIGDCLFSSQRHTHRINNARKLVKLAGELAELAALVEQGP